MEKKNRYFNKIARRLLLYSAPPPNKNPVVENESLRNLCLPTFKSVAWALLYTLFRE